MDRLVRRIQPWASSNGSEGLDSLVMESRDRAANLGFFAAAGVVWLLVGLVLTTRDPVVDPMAGFIGAGLIGLAVALTLVPLIWLTVFGRHRQIAYRGDWVRAVRRSAWVGIIVAVVIVASRAGPPGAADRPVPDRPHRRGGGDALRGTLTRVDCRGR